MGTLTVRDLDDTVKDRLRVRAANNGRSMEAEARAILSAAVQDVVDQDGERTSDQFPPPGVRIAKLAMRRGGWSTLARDPGGRATHEVLDELRAERLDPGTRP